MTEDQARGDTILIVDDNPNNIRVLFGFLAGEGFRALTARSGEEAVDSARKSEPDLILLDVMMPGVDGFEACRRLKGDPETSDIPVIFMTALSETSHKVQGFESGAVDYITKPFELAEVLARVETHLTIQRQKRELAEINATKDRFVSIVAHDVRNVFASLLTLPGGIDLCLEQKDYAKAGEFAGRLTASMKGAHTLFENLLDWSRAELGVMEFTPAALDPREVADDTIGLLMPGAEQKGIRLSNAIREGATVYADRRMVETVLRNLVSNALKFTGDGGAVEVTARPDAQFVEFSVSDTGVGMDKDAIGSLFRIDRKVTTRGTAGEKGTGLGLLLCKQLVEKCGGRIWVESEPSEGSAFKFVLPRAQTDAMVGLPDEE